jgi:hypothetical protein
MYIRAKGPELSIPQTCFWIEIVANLGNLNGFNDHTRR